MKVLLFGRDGQVGTALRVPLDGLGEVVALGHAEADFEQPNVLADIVRTERPEIIVNAAAYTAVDAAEDDRERAWTINAGAIDAIGEAAARLEALVVHYSTDYVFDGKSTAPYREDDATSPLSVYGASKLAGEALLMQSGARHLIFRTSWVFAPRGRNFALTILRLAKERESLDVVVDQVGAPTSADTIATVTAHTILQAMRHADHRGLYHLAPRGEASWFDYARLLVGEARAAGAQLRLEPDAIRPIAATDYPTKAARPTNSRLDTTKLESTFDVRLPAWQEGVARLITTLKVEGRL